MLTVKEVDDFVQTFEQHEDGAMKNGFVIKIMQDKNMKSATEVVATLCKKPVNKGALTSKLRRLSIAFKKYRGYNLRIESNRRALLNLLNDIFTAPDITTTFTPDPTELSSVPTPSLHPCASSPLPTTLPMSVSAVLQMTPISVVGSLRGDCSRCEETRASGAAAVTAVKRQLSATKSVLSAVKTTYQVKRINLFKKRKKEQIESKKKRIKDLEKANRHLMAELDKVKRQCVQQKAEIFDLHKKVKSLEKNINRMHDQTKQIQ